MSQWWSRVQVLGVCEAWRVVPAEEEEGRICGVGAVGCVMCRPAM
jgi:hypothetical protein